MVVTAPLPTRRDDVIRGRSPGSDADQAEPYFQLDLADIEAYIQAYIGPDPIVDYVAPYGVVDLAEIVAFVQAFQAGCP